MITSSKYSLSVSLLIALLMLGLPVIAKVATLAVYSEPAAKGSTTRVAVGQWDLPDKPPAGFYRVKMLRSEICNTDRRVLAGTKRAELTRRKVVMGHEGIGRIHMLPTAGANANLHVGDLVVVAPHYVESNDPLLKRGLPNLSPRMKHTGIHMNGVFANLMDFPAYNIIKIPDADEMVKKVADPQIYYDQMVMIEPLSCVQRGYKLLQKQDYFKGGQIKNALILGSGPMGVIHALHLQNKYPEVDVDIFDVDPIRRNLAKNVPNSKAHVLESLDYDRHYDLVVTATSSESAATSNAIKLVKDNGVVLLFSGIDLKEGEAHPKVGPVDIEDVHRYEGSLRLMNHYVDGRTKSIYFLGTSGYVEDDFKSAIEELHEDLLAADKGIYRALSTTLIEGLNNKNTVDLSRRFHDAHFPSPALIHLLQVYNAAMKGDYNVHNYLKIFVRHD